MTVTDFYLLCFLVGLVLTVVFSLAGSAHLHLPHFDLHHVHLPHADAPHGGNGARGGHIAPINIGTVTAFFAWFGGAGYLMTHYYGVWLWLGVGVAIAAGLAGSAIVFWFVAKVLVSHDENLDPADYEMVGVLGRITSSIRAGGTGELVFSQQGTRRTTGACSEDGTAIPKGAEVIVTRYEKGIAYVRTWDTAIAPASTSNQRVDR
jgi:membrane protein implicated in regulation of membrane protease activity